MTGLERTKGLKLGEIKVVNVLEINSKGTRGGVSDSVWEDVWRFREDLRKWQPTPVLLPGKSHGWRSLVGYSPRDCKESDTTERKKNNTRNL